MKKHLNNGWFRRASALLLSLTTAASVATAAAPEPVAYAAVSAEEVYDGISVSAENVNDRSISAISAADTVLARDEVYATEGSAPVAALDEVTEQKIKDMNFTVDFAPNHYVASRKAANKTKYYPERNEAWGYKVYGSAPNDNWFYRSIRWMSYFKKGDTVDPLFPYNETEDRVDSYWHGSWKYYPSAERTDVGSTCYLGDADAWHKVTPVSGENRALITNKHTAEGVDSSNGSTYCCGITTVPIKAYFTVPANTSYRVTLKFSASAYCIGESSLALIDSFPGMQSTDVEPNKESWVVNSDHVKTLKYNEFADVLKNSAGRLGFDMIPTSGNGDFQSTPASQTKYFDYELTNNTGSSQTFMRCFFLVITQAMDYKHEVHTSSWSYYDGEVSMSVADLHYDTGTTELEEEDNKEAEVTDTSERLTVSVGERSTTADGSSANYGIYGVTNRGSTIWTGLLQGYYGDRNTSGISVCYTGRNDNNVKADSRAAPYGSAKAENNKVAVSCPSKITQDGSTVYVPFSQACIPVKLSYRVPANTRTSVTYTAAAKLDSDANGEWVVGLLEGAANDSLTETMATAAALNGSVPTYYASDAVISINGTSSTGNICSKSFYQDDAAVYGVPLTNDYLKDNPAVKKSVAAISMAEGKENSGTTLFTQELSFEFDNLASDTETVFERYFVIYSIHQHYVYENSYTTLKNLDYSLSFTHSETNKRPLKTEEGITKYYLEWENDDTMSVLNDVKGEESDKDPSKAQGWHRLVMTVPKATFNYNGNTSFTFQNSTTITGQVSEDGFTNVQPYFTHPLGYYLRYAWLYNGVSSKPGADGYDIARPLCFLDPQALPASYTTDSTNNGAAYIPTEPVEGTLTRDDYQAWYIKAADDEGGFYLAMEGTDGKRHLLCHNVTCEGNTAVEHTLCFVTAAEYEAYPELYQTAYAWPITYNAATSLSVNNVGRHKYKGFWQKTADESTGTIITEGNLRDEAFRFPVKNNLVWRCVNDNESLFYGFYSMIEVQDITDPNFQNEDYSLYTYYQTYKDQTGTVDQQILSEYSAEIQHCLTIFKEAPVTYVGAKAVVTDSGSSYVNFRQLYEKNDLLRLNVSLGTYTDDTPEKQITVGNGQVYKVTGKSKITSDQTMVIEKGGTLQITGTLVNEGTLICYGTVIIENGGCLRDAADSVSGEYSYVGGTLIISTNGIFRQTIAGTGNGYNRFYAGSTIYNDGLLISSSGLALDASTLDNGSNGVVMTACTLRASSDLYTPRELALSFPRGLPDGETQYKLVSQLMRTYIDQNYSRFSTNPPQNHRNKLYLTNQSVVRNNGVMYCTGGIYLESGTDNGKNVLIGNNPIIMYTPLVNGSYENEKGETVKWAHTDMNRYGFYTDNEPMNNNISENDWQGTWIADTTSLGESSNYVKFGCQSIGEALAGSTMSTSAWESNYNDYSKFKPSGDGGC